MTALGSIRVDERVTLAVTGILLRDGALIIKAAGNAAQLVGLPDGDYQLVLYDPDGAVVGRGRWPVAWPQLCGGYRPGDVLEAELALVVEDGVIGAKSGTTW